MVNNLCIGGVTELIKNTTPRLLYDYEISILSLGSDISVWKDIPGIDIVCFEIDPEFNYSLPNYFQDMIIGNTIKGHYQKVIDYLIKTKPDFIHFHTLPRFLKIGTIVNKKISCNLIFTDHSVRIAKDEYNPFIRFALSSIYRVLYNHYHLIFVSKTVEDVALAYNFIGKNKKYQLINNGIDTKYYQCENKIYSSKNSVIFIYVSRICPGKGHLELIKSWENIKSDIERELWLVGPNGMADQLQNLINISDSTNIKMLGSRKDIKELLSMSDIAVFPSSKEGLPLSLLEKMAMNLPVIVSNIDELTSVIEHRKDGLIYELENGDDLTNKMTILLEDKNLRIKMGNQARKKIEENYSVITVVKKIRQLYNSLLK